jgi:uncharacterized membrane protein YhfC
MVSTSVIASLAFYTILPPLFGVAIFLICRGRMTLSVRNIAIGAVTFFLFSQVLEAILNHYVLSINAVTVGWMQLHPYGFALYASLAAGLFEETGRYLAMRFLVKDTGNPGTAVAYGLGHGGIEAILIGSMSIVVPLVYAVKLYMGQDAQLIAILGPEGLAQVRTDLQSIPHVMFIMQMVERLIALMLHIGLSVVVWRAVQQRQLAWLALAVLLHTAIDFPVGLMMVGQISHDMMMGWLVLIGSVLAVCFLYGLPRKSAPVVVVPQHA